MSLRFRRGSRLLMALGLSSQKQREKMGSRVSRRVGLVTQALHRMSRGVAAVAEGVVEERKTRLIISRLHFKDSMIILKTLRKSTTTSCR